MKKTILIGALLLVNLAQANMERCTKAVKLRGISTDKGIEAYSNKDFKGACGYIQLANSFIEKGIAYCPAELLESLEEAYIQGKRTEAAVCNIK